MSIRCAEFRNGIQVNKPEDYFHVHWGGPDCPPRYLRDQLEEAVHAVPSGGEILWVTYYFRDENLASALLEAKRRGVKVRLVMEGKPRTKAANVGVRKLLQGKDGLGEEVRVLSHRLIDNRFLRLSRLHEKLYYFSHPVPCVMAGTFNPSGNVPECPDIIRKIGDQDRGHNMLVRIGEPTLVQGLYSHAQRLFRMHHGPWERFLRENNRVITSGKTQMLFFPRLRRQELDKLFDDLEGGGALRIAMSHINDPQICRRLSSLAQKGVQIEVLAHDTERRVPEWVAEQMRRQKINFKRYVHPDGLPMHNKFMLFETAQRKIAAFGSMNLSVRSLRVNHELLIIAEDSCLYEEFQKRLEKMFKEVNR